MNDAQGMYLRGTTAEQAAELRPSPALREALRPHQNPGYHVPSKQPSVLEIRQAEHARLMLLAEHRLAMCQSELRRAHLEPKAKAVVDWLRRHRPGA